MEEEKEKSKSKENQEISKKKSSLIIRSSKTKEFSPLKRKTTFALTSIFKTKSSKKKNNKTKKKIIKFKIKSSKTIYSISITKYWRIKIERL